MAESVEDSARFVDIPDAEGNTQYTLFSTTGKPQSAEAFAAALSRYKSSGEAGKGFVVLQPGAMSTLRRGFETATEPIQENLPVIGRGVGSIAASSPLLALGRMAGIIPERSAPNVVTLGGTVGEALGSEAARQVSTPGRAGMTAASAASAPLMAGVTSAQGAMRLAPVIGNMLKAGVAGATGYATGEAATGGGFDFGKTAAEFGIAALGGGLQSVLGHWITKYITGDKADKVARSVVDTVAERYPSVKKDPGLINISGSGASDVSRMTQRGAEGLRGSIDDVSQQYLDGIKNVLPAALSAKQRVAWQNTARAHVRSIVGLQNKMLDNINDATAYNAARAELEGTFDAQSGQYVGGKLNALRDFIVNSFPNLKNVAPLQARIDALYQGYASDMQHFAQGSRVLAYIREASGDEGFDPQRFADLIRGVYQQPGNPLLERVGTILGGGRPLTQMPVTQPPSNLERLGTGAYNILKEQILPGAMGRALPSLESRGARSAVPWPAPVYNPATGRSASPLSTGTGALAGFAAQQAAQAPLHEAADSEGVEAMKRYMRRK